MPDAKIGLSQAADVVDAIPPLFFTGAETVSPVIKFSKEINVVRVEMDATNYVPGTKLTFGLQWQTDPKAPLYGVEATVEVRGDKDDGKPATDTDPAVPPTPVDIWWVAPTGHQPLPPSTQYTTFVRVRGGLGIQSSVSIKAI